MDLQLNSSSATNLPRHANQTKVVYTISERQGRSYWTRVGVGFVNRDGSINIRLDAIPVSGQLQLRDWTPRDAGADSDGPPTRSAHADDAASGPSKIGLGDGGRRTADIPF